MRKNEATRIRLETIERKELGVISEITGLPISVCIRAMISAFVRDFKKNKGKIYFPMDMNAQLCIWSAIQKKYDIPSYISSMTQLEEFVKRAKEKEK